MIEPGSLPINTHGPIPEMVEPLMFVNLAGWIDASGAGAAAIEHIAKATDATEILDFDGDLFIDSRARRPVMEIRDGVNNGLRWNVPMIRWGKDAHGKDVLLLSGPEPDFAWRLFCSTVGTIAGELGVQKVIGLGAYPYGTPHTRPVQITHTTPNKATSDRLTSGRNTLDVPGGAVSYLELELEGRGILAIEFWAQVPHYVATMQFSAASEALIRAASRETGLVVDTSELIAETETQRARLDELVGANSDHGDMVTKLEEAYDAAHRPAALDIATDLPTAEQLAAEVEQFLRNQQTGEER